MPSSPPPPRSRRLVAAALLVVGLALLGAAIWLAVSGGQSTASSEQLLVGSSTAEAATPTAPATKAREESAGSSEQTAEIAPGRSLAPAVLAGYDGGFTALGCDPSSDPGESAATLTGELAVWQPLTLSFAGPAAGAADTDPNPFLDYRLTVRFVAPSGHSYNVPGTFDGDGRGGTGDRWSARFAADEAGRWRWCASFRAGPGVAVDLDPTAGAPLAFNGESGAFDIAPLAAASASEAADATIVATRPSPPATRDFFTLGRLEYANGHYLKFRDGPYWIKTGTNSPENLLAYVGFEDSADTPPGFRHAYAAHVADWQPGDPTLPGAADKGKGIIGALNYLAESGVNSVYFLPMNLGGDGNDTWPFLSPNDVTHYDLGKLAAWRVVFEHAQRRGIALHVVLSETEPTNRGWLESGPVVEGGSTAPSILSTPRRLFYRELVARFADLPAIKWNLAEESVYSSEEAIALAGYLAVLDWAGHPIALHNPADWFGPYEDTLGRAEFSATSIQYQPDEAGALVERWRAASAGAGRPWVIDMDENRPAQEGLMPDNAGPLRKTILYDALFSGAGGIEWYLGYHPLPVGGDLNVEDFRTRAEMWAYAAHAR
ncbi:MAG: DUF5060 domain-containing protein, partial [Candidatus Promineofilum sp.]|nr:DUF5060 domain-containing protein [Promineifilum sp.]